MFLDASAVVAVLLNEPEAPGLLKAMEASRGTLRFSPVVRMEATLALVGAKVQARGKGHGNGKDYRSGRWTRTPAAGYKMHLGMGRKRSGRCRFTARSSDTRRSLISGTRYKAYHCSGAAIF